MEFRTTAELATLWRVDGEIALKGWYSLLTRWRDQGRLQPSRDWRFEGRERVYLEPRVLSLVWQSPQLFAERVKLSNFEAIRKQLAR